MKEIIIDETKLKEAFLNYIECVTKLKQENEELKEGYIKLQIAFNAEQENEELRIQNSNFDNQLYRANEMLSNCNSKLQDYKQALEEIREIAENSCSIPCADCCYDCENCEDEITNNGETCMQYGLDKITNKINEVLGND